MGEGRGEGKTTTPLSADLNPIPDNRLKTYNGTTYYYDDLGNLIHRELQNGEVQNYFYDLHDQLVKAEIFKKDGTKETWAYSYDALGRRISKGRLKDGEVSGSLEEETRFVWDGSHLLQEIQPDGRYTYIYTDQDSYEPLAQVRDWATEDGENRQQTHYFHCDQIGIPREMTDKDGNLLWFGNYTGWGRLKEETKVTDSAYQPFRLQNQYADRETGLHYNFFRYYEPDAGRFVNQDPIGLLGGNNLYQFAPNAQGWVDWLGLSYGFNIKANRWTNFETGKFVQKPSTLSGQAQAVHNLAGGLKPSKISIEKSTVAIFEVQLRDGSKTLYAAGSSGVLNPRQRALLKQIGVPEKNILFGKGSVLPVTKVNSNINHAEQIILRNIPKDAKVTRKGISWSSKHKNAPCSKCQSSVDGAGGVYD